MQFEKKVCFNHPCDPCELKQLKTDLSREVGATAVDYGLKHVSFHDDLDEEEVERFGGMAADQYGIPDVKPQVTAAIIRTMQGDCAERSLD